MDSKSLDEIVKKFFSDDQWTNFVEIEKNRYINIYDNYLKLKSLGLNPKFPNFPQSKSTKEDDTESDTETEDEEWIPEVKKKNKPEKFKFRPKKTKASIHLKSTLKGRLEALQEGNEVDTDAETENALPLSSSQSSVQHLWHSVTLVPDVRHKVRIGEYYPSTERPDDVSKKKRKKTEVTKTVTSTDDVTTPKNDVTSSEQRRYPKRNCSRKNYNESKTYNNDDYIFCDSCNEDFEGGCPLHPLILLLNNNVARNGSVIDRGKTTAPWPLYISQSKVAEAGLGVWTSAHLPKGLLFGPYEGRICLNVDPGEESGYGWKIRNDVFPGKCIDAVDSSISNWLRYVNCSRSYDETNLVAFQYKGEIYYKTVMDIKRGTELMVWYGDEYGKELGYKLEDTNGKTLKSSKEEGKKSKLLSAPAKSCKKQSLFTKYKSTNGDIFPDIYDIAVYCMINNNNNKSDINNNNVDEDKAKLNLLRKVIDELVEDRFSCKQESKSRLDYSSEVSEALKNVNKAQVPVTDNSDKDCALEKSKSLNHIETVSSQPSNIDQRIAKSEKLFSCQYCEKKYCSSNGLKFHIRMHTGEKLFKCNHCDKKIYNSGCLKIHLRIHTGEKPFKCNHCNKKFNILSNLKTHLRIHTGEKPFQCNYCEKKFNRLDALKKHLLIHTGEKPFKCNHCNKKFNQSEHLKTHLRIHTGEKPFQCNYCDKKFNQSENLKKHLRIHTGEKPFQCNYCDKKFNQSVSLKKHLHIHTREKPLTKTL